MIAVCEFESTLGTDEILSSLEIFSWFFFLLACESAVQQPENWGTWGFRQFLFNIDCYGYLGFEPVEDAAAAAATVAPALSGAMLTKVEGMLGPK